MHLYVFVSPVSVVKQAQLYLITSIKRNLRGLGLKKLVRFFFWMLCNDSKEKEQLTEITASPNIHIQDECMQLSAASVIFTYLYTHIRMQAVYLTLNNITEMLQSFRWYCTFCWCLMHNEPANNIHATSADAALELHNMVYN